MADLEVQTDYKSDVAKKAKASGETATDTYRYVDWRKSDKAKNVPLGSVEKMDLAGRRGEVSKAEGRGR